MEVSCSERTLKIDCVSSSEGKHWEVEGLRLLENRRFLTPEELLAFPLPCSKVTELVSVVGEDIDELYELACRSGKGMGGIGKRGW